MSTVLSSNIIFDNLLTLLIFLWMAVKAATIHSQAGEFLMCTAFGNNDLVYTLTAGK